MFGGRLPRVRASVGAVGGGGSLVQRLGAARPCGLSGKTTCSSAGAGGFFCGLELVEAVERLAHAEHRMAHVPAHRPRADFHVDQEQRRVLGAELLQRAGRGAHRVAVRGLGRRLVRPGRPAARARRRRPAARAAAGSSRSCRRGRASAFLQRALGGLVDAPRGGASARCPEKRPTTTQPVFAVSGESVFMLNSTGAKVSHDLPPRAAQGVRRSRGRRVHDAVRDRAHHAAHPPARPGRRRQVSLGRGVRLPRLLRARRAAGAALAHHVHLGAAHA